MFRFIIILLAVVILPSTTGLLRRCYQCRSRGELGTCKDPFKGNETSVEQLHGISMVPCSSGWCGKVVEGKIALRDDDYDIATQRTCVQRGPSDSEDRCAYTMVNYKKVFMCFCQGDLCNSSTNLGSNRNHILLFGLIAVGWLILRLR